MKYPTIALFVAALHGALGASAGAQVVGPSKCTSKKVVASAKKVFAKGKCEAKAIAKGVALDAACLAKAEAKFENAFGKAETAPDCLAPVSASQIEAKVDRFLRDVRCELSCPRQRITFTSGPGTIAVSTLPSFPVAGGAITTVDMQADVGGCRYRATVPPGGFISGAFCIPSLNITAGVFATGCESGGQDGAGTVWPGGAPCPDADVKRVGDTSDGVCNPPSQPCTTGAGGAGANEFGDVDAVRGDGACDPTPGLHVQLDIPVVLVTWFDVDGNCPDEDGVYNPGTDTSIHAFDLILSPTTATAEAALADKDLDGSGPAVADGCAFTGNGPPHTKVCSNASNEPCGNVGTLLNPADCGGPPATCVDGVLTGSPAPGPCCNVGDPLVMVTAGVAFSNIAVLGSDVVFSTKFPATVTACAPVGPAAACTPTTNACRD
jgi:hypothetical protein